MTITVDAVCYYRTFDPVTAVINVENAQFSTTLLVATSLRNILGTRTLQEILQDKENIAHQMEVVFYIILIVIIFISHVLIIKFKELLDESTKDW